VRRTLRFVRGALLAYGPSFTKRFLWDGEYSQGKWDFIDHTAGDCVYPYLEKYARGGSILDLGCGPGNTASELPATAYTSYLGVDISDVCLEKARRRSEAERRSDKNAFTHGDLLSYAPPRAYDVILLRESLYHLPMRKIPATLRRYSRYLTSDGVFIIRVFTLNHGKALNRPRAMLDCIEREFVVLERREHTLPGSVAVILVLRAPKPGITEDTRGGQ
jgi:SAM-dependent methyltransferase